MRPPPPRVRHTSAVSGIPVVGPFLAPPAAAAAFAAVMAFEQGGVVPGIGHGDTVPAMFTPGEGIVPGSTMDKLNGLARAGGLDAPGRATLQVHYRPTYHVNTIDASGVRGMLKKHGGEFSRHLNDEVRKLNR